MHSISYELERWKRHDWRKEQKHYCCELKQDLFGRWIVVRRWGRVTATKGQSREHQCSSYEEGLEILAQVERRRRCRGYSTMRPLIGNCLSS